MEIHMKIAVSSKLLHQRDKYTILYCRGMARHVSIFAFRRSVMARRASILAFRRSVMARRASILAFRRSVTARRASILAFRRSVMARRASILAFHRSVMARTLLFSHFAAALWRVALHAAPSLQRVIAPCIGRLDNKNISGHRHLSDEACLRLDVSRWTTKIDAPDWHVGMNFWRKPIQNSKLMQSTQYECKYCNFVLCAASKCNKLKKNV
ncbi:MAG: hypothetical protein LBJ57_02490 [Prevotellaceae bacterium]|jgi:hypothetical protein|nr:hypothetical protein [Prevotellaceae bacterium]